MHMGRMLEEGSIELFYRPRVEEHDPGSIDDVQRLLIVLCPKGRARYRLIAVGRKRMEKRFWGFVDLVLDDSRDLDAALSAHVYGTKTRGVRHLPAAREFARGDYQIEEHDGHTHLRYVLREMRHDKVAEDLAVEPEASFIVSVANPDPAAWDLAELPDMQMDLFDETEVHVTIPTPFPPALQQRFEGRRYAPLDTAAWLDHPGAELIFIS
jgi:hypothetical protein